MGSDNGDDMDTEIIDLNNKREEQQRGAGRRAARKRTAKMESITRLKSLECFDEVDDMVREGVYTREIAEYIQDVKGEYADVSIDAVIRSLRRYRETLEDVGVEAAASVGEEVDSDDPLRPLHVLEEMFEEQRSRIMMEVGTEKNLRKLFSTTHKEFETLKLLGSELLKQRRLLGIIGPEAERKRKRREGNRIAGRLKYAEVIQSPESRQKVLSVVEVLLSDDELMGDIVSRGSVGDLPEENEPKKLKPKSKSKKAKPKKAKPKKAKPKKAKPKTRASKKAAQDKDNDSPDTRRETPVP